MPKNTFLLAILVTLTACPYEPQGEPPVPAGRRLRAIVADRYADNSIILGATVGSSAFGSPMGLILDREFSYVTPENDFKQAVIHPKNGQEWNWERADAWVSYIAENGQVLRMHGPVSPQCSMWAKQDYRTAVELDEAMRAFMRALCERYNGTPGFEYLDVVNETVVNGGWHTDKPGTRWECPWYKIGLGADPNGTPLYITAAFEIAQQYAPDVKFIYNHHEPPTNTASWELIKATVLYLRTLGLRVDGIGWQAHIDAGSESLEGKRALEALIDWAQANALEFHVTEASAWLKHGHTQADQEVQGATYRAILDILLKKRFGGKVGWNTWHVSDAHTWHAEWHPAIFDAKYVAKPAYYAIQDALESGAEGPARSQE